jgi:hypothetical protein
MERRTFVTFCYGGGVPLVVRAQQSAMPVIGSETAPLVNGAVS